MIRLKSLTYSSRAALFLAPLLIAAFGAACGGAKQNAASDSASSSPASALGAVEAFEGEIKAKMFPDDRSMEIRYAVKGSRLRIETPLSPGNPYTSAVLLDLSAGTQTMLLPQNKTYMILDWDAVAGEMAKEVGKDSSSNYLKVTSTGKTETIAGFTCQHWLVGDKQNTDVCIAKGLGYFGGGSGESDGILSALRNLAQREKIKAQMDADPEFAKFVEGGAFPLKITQIENGQSMTVLEVTSVERKPMDDSLFTIPAGYKKMELPGMPTGKR